MAGAVFTYDLSRWNDAIRRKLRETPLFERRAMQQVSALLGREAQKRAPVDKGFLTASILHTVVPRGSGFVAAVYVPVNAPGAQYAIPMHEHHYALGPNSLEKQRKVGVPVGRRYIARALDDNAEKIFNIIKREIGVQ